MTGDDEQPVLPREVPDWVRQVGLFSWYFVGVSAAVAILVFLLGAAREIIVPLVLAAFLAAIFEPAVDWLQQRRLPRAVSAVLVVIGIYVVLLGSLGLVVFSVGAQSDEIVDRTEVAIDDVKEWLEDQDVDTSILESDANDLSDGAGVAVNGVAAQAVGVVGTVFTALAGVVLGTMILYYLLKDGPSLIEDGLDRVQHDRRDQNLALVEDALGSVRAYFRGRSILAAVQGIVIGIASMVLGVPFPGAIGVVNFVGAYIPYFGAVLGGGFAVLMALSEGGLGSALVILGVVLAVNLILENALEPWLLGEQLEMHPLFVLLATIVGGLAAGLVGLILAAPVAAMVRRLYGELRDVGFFRDAAARVADSTGVTEDTG